MGAELASKCNQCCATNQSLDRDRMTQHQSKQRSKASRKGHTLYGAKPTSSTSFDSSYHEGEASYSDAYSDSSEPYVDPRKIAYQAQVVESFKAAVQAGNTSLVEYYFNEHPELYLGRTRWRNGNALSTLNVPCHSIHDLMDKPEYVHVLHSTCVRDTKRRRYIE